PNRRVRRNAIEAAPTRIAVCLAPRRVVVSAQLWARGGSSSVPSRLSAIYVGRQQKPLPCLPFVVGVISPDQGRLAANPIAVTILANLEVERSAVNGL